MWVCGTMVYLIPAVAIVAQLLSSQTGAPGGVQSLREHEA